MILSVCRQLASRDARCTSPMEVMTEYAVQLVPMRLPAGVATIRSRAAMAQTFSKAMRLMTQFPVGAEMMKFVVARIKMN